MCRLYGIVCVLFRTRLIFPRINGPIVREKSPYFRQHLFTRARLHGQDFVTGRNFSFNQCDTRVLRFFSRKLFYKSNKTFFSCVCVAWYKHSMRWENSRQLCEHGKRCLLLNCTRKNKTRLTQDAS